MSHGTRAPRRDEFDPRAPSLRIQKKLGDYNLDLLADISNGKSAALAYASNYRKEDALTTTPDVSMICQEVSVTIQETNEIQVWTVEDAFHKGKDMCMSQESRDWLTSQTTSQSESVMWHEQRKGRITASNMGNVLKHVSSGMEIVGATHSITASIMGYYNIPHDHLPKALAWGKQNETQAIERYTKHQSKHHHLDVVRTGLWVSLNEPFIAASPDAMVECSCCGAGLVEVKCPWTHREKGVHELAEVKESCLEMEDSTIKLKLEHAYYAQVQTQLYCTGRTYCDFVVMTKSANDSLCIIRIKADESFIQVMRSKSKVFWEQIIKTELLTRAVQKKIISAK